MNNNIRLCIKSLSKLRHFVQPTDFLCKRQFGTERRRYSNPPYRSALGRHCRTPKPLVKGFRQRLSPASSGDPKIGASCAW